MSGVSKEQGQAACDAFNAALQKTQFGAEWGMKIREGAHLFDPANTRTITLSQHLSLRVDMVRPHKSWNPNSPRYVFTLGHTTNKAAPAGQYEITLSNKLIGNSAVKSWVGPDVYQMNRFNAMFFKEQSAEVIRGMAADSFLFDEYAQQPKEEALRSTLKGYENGGAW